MEWKLAKARVVEIMPNFGLVQLRGRDSTGQSELIGVRLVDFFSLLVLAHNGHKVTSISITKLT